MYDGLEVERRESTRVVPDGAWATDGDGNRYTPGSVFTREEQEWITLYGLVRSSGPWRNEGRDVADPVLIHVKVDA